jgi:formate-dependent nitrite reductase membrane component NrfD
VSDERQDDRRFVNNPFARGLHPEKARRTAGQWVALILVSLFAAIVMGAAFVLPLLFAHGLLARSHGRAGMIAAGVIVAAIYALIVVRLVRRR